MEVCGEDEGQTFEIHSQELIKGLPARQNKFWTYSAVVHGIQNISQFPIPESVETESKVMLGVEKGRRSVQRAPLTVTILPCALSLLLEDRQGNGSL